MIEFRAITRKNLRFESGFKLEAGTFIYVQETPSGWLGTYYTDKGSAYAFNLEDDAFSILQSADCQVETLVVMPDPPDPPAQVKETRELARRRVQAQIKRHRDAADELEHLLKGER